MSNNTKTKANNTLIVIRKTFSVILTLLLVVCLIFIVYSAINSNGNGFYIGPYQFVSVLTGSMEPTLSIGSLAVVKRVSENELSIGDIITFKPLEDQTLVTHRITDISSDGSSFTTMGDNNNIEDSDPVHYKNVIGKVVFWIPLIGYLFIALKTPPGIITLVAIIILYEFIRFFLRKQNEAKRGENTDEKTN